MTDSFEKGQILLDSEGDVRCHLFSCCLRLMMNNNIQQPFKIHSEKTIGNRRIDIVLGNNEVGIEIKFLKKYATTPTFEDLKREAQKVASYIVKEKQKQAFLAIVDKRGTARRGLKPLSQRFESWRTITTKSGAVTFALCSIKP